MGNKPVKPSWDEICADDKYWTKLPDVCHFEVSDVKDKFTFSGHINIFHSRNLQKDLVSKYSLGHPELCYWYGQENTKKTIDDITVHIDPIKKEYLIQEMQYGHIYLNSICIPEIKSLKHLVKYGTEVKSIFIESDGYKKMYNSPEYS